MNQNFNLKPKSCKLHYFQILKNFINFHKPKINLFKKKDNLLHKQKNLKLKDKLKISGKAKNKKKSRFSTLKSKISTKK